MLSAPGCGVANESSGGGGGGTVGPGAIGRLSKFTATDAVGNSSVNDTGDYATQRIGLGIGNLVGGLFTAVKSSAVGYGNQIGQTANADNATAVGYANEINNATSAYTVGGSTAVGAKNKIGTAAHAAYKSSAFGDYNHIGQLRTATYSTAVGYSNYVDSINASAFGNSNRIGSAANACRFSTVLGSSNVIGNYTAALRATASGYANHIDNADDGNAFGTRNLVGSTAYSATKSSAIGYRNYIGQTANANKATAVGYKNFVNSPLAASAVGYFNRIGTVSSTGDYGSAFGYGNRVGQVATANEASAFGDRNRAENFMAVAFGALNRSYGYKGSCLGVQNYVGNAGNPASYSVAVGNHNYVGNLSGGNAEKANAFGYKNSILNSNYASAIGVKNSIGTTTYTAHKSNAIGYDNQIGQTENNAHSTAVGSRNIVKSRMSTAVGYFNTIDGGGYGKRLAIGTQNKVGSAGFTANYSSAVGYGNYVAQAAVVNMCSAFGTKNVVDNVSYGSVFGAKNKVGSAGYTATKSSAFGYRNTIGQNGDSNFSSVFGYGNTCNNSIFACGIGTNNALGSAAYTASRSCAIGAGNQIGITANAERSCAFGFSNLVLASYANAFGYKAVARIPKTTNICGPQIIRKDNGEAANTAFESFCGTEVILFSKEVDLNAVADQTITLPAGCSCWINEVGIIETVQNGTITSQPFIHAGITGSTQKYLANVITTKLTAAKKRQRYTTLLDNDGEGEGSVVMGVSTGAVLNSASQYKGRFYVKIILLEDE